MLRRAIASWKNQTEECECIVVDDASTDETPLVVKQFARVQYIRNTTARGHSAAANAGIKAAHSEWIKPLDDDDWLAPDCIEILSRSLAEARSRGFATTLISGRAIQMDEQAKELSRTPRLTPVPAAVKSHDLLALMMLDQAPLGTPVQVGHSREAALEVGGWNESRPFAHQHGDEAEFWIKLATRGDAVFVPDLIAYRTNWTGGSQRGIPHLERYRSNLLLKDQIACALNRHTPQSIASYLALHWALVAAKDWHFKSAMKLGFKWMKNPESAIDLLDHHRMKRAQFFLRPLSASASNGP